MNFIEQVIGLSPDGGSGAFEALLLAALAALFLAHRLYKSPRHR